MTKQASLYEELKELESEAKFTETGRAALDRFLHRNLPAILSALKDSERYREALREIALMGMTVPVEMGEPTAEWYKSRAYFAISTAAWALAPDAAQSQEDRHG